jgi:putative proteasome-type protease
MTYCVAIRCNEGLVFGSDSRTNAGMDNVNTYSKMHVFACKNDRLIVLLSAGNLGTTQQVVTTLRKAMEEQQSESLLSCRSMDDVAAYVGRVSQRVQHGYTMSGGFDSGVTFIVGGQIGKEPHNIYLVYQEGNYISCSERKPFLQIGEIKYGKPILDRIIDADIPLEDAARCALVSIDSTMRSNVTVGPPVELLLYRADSLEPFQHLVLDHDTPYLASIEREWALALRRGFDGLPRFTWEIPEKGTETVAAVLHPVIHN